MNVGDIIEVGGKKVRVTWCQGNNYSYEILNNAVKEDTAEESPVVKRNRKKGT